MINLIEKFFEDAESMRVFVNNPEKQRNGDFQEVYFFMGKDSVLCISKMDNKVLSKIALNQLQINLLSTTEFSINVNGQSLFFCQNEVNNQTVARTVTQEESLMMETVCTFQSEQPQPTSVTENQSLREMPPRQQKKNTPDNKYPYRSHCEECSSKKCSQYDTLNGRNFRFGNGQVSNDLLDQHEKYCQTKMQKFGCVL